MERQSRYLVWDPMNTAEAGAESIEADSVEEAAGIYVKKEEKRNGYHADGVVEVDAFVRSHDNLLFKVRVNIDCDVTYRTNRAEPYEEPIYQDNSFADARDVMASALVGKTGNGDDSGYRANIAMLLFDKFPRANLSDPKTCNVIAEELINLIFASTE